MDRERFDRIFDQSFEEAARNSEFVPDSEPSWLNIEKRLLRRARLRRRLRLTPYIALSFLIGALVFGTPIVSIAFHPMIESAATIRDGVVELTVGRQKPADTAPKTDAPPDYAGQQDTLPQEGLDIDSGGMSHNRHSTLAEAVDKLAFKPPTLTYLPDVFEMTEIQTFRPHDESKDQQLTITYNRKDGAEGFFHLHVQVFPPGSLMKITSEQSQIATETIVINGYEAYLQVSDEGYAGLQYFVDHLYIAITGALERNEIVAIAEGLRFS
ncbi:DUF4367 domain-containing protein [Paenibacillus sp. strain BS8-2]